jgi:molybdopterin synthase sulfur carrier subunit
MGDAVHGGNDAMLKVLILGSTLQKLVPETELEIDLPSPTPVKKLLQERAEELGPLAHFAQQGELLVTVNKKVSTLDSVVRDGDLLKLSHQSRASYDGTRDIPT